MQMKKRQRWLMRFMVMGVLAVAVGMTSSAQAQTTANGPYYATPSWDQTLPSATRFVVLSNFNMDAVLDRNTGLVWMRTPLFPIAPWRVARNNCSSRVVAGQMGWRLPAMVELSSLIDSNAGTALALPVGHPFNIPNNPNNPSFLFWSATTVADAPQIAWGIYLSGFSNVSQTDKTIDGGIWCVRGGMNAEAY